MATVNPTTQERFQNAQASAMNQPGTSVVMATFAQFQEPVTYWRSISRNAAACGSASSGAGNQNMLERTANVVSAIPSTLRR